MARKNMQEIFQEWMSDPSYKKAYDALEDEFKIARELIAARIRADLTQEQVAERMHTKQSFVSKLESGQYKFSLETLKRYAKATGSEVDVRLIKRPSA